MPLDYRQIALDSILPAAELLAAALNCLVATFPVSVICGLLFLANYHGLTGELGYALLRRYRIWGWVWLGLLAACALASLLKPLTILTLPELARILSFYELLVVSSVVNGLSFAFEYLLGTCLQVYLLLIAYGWVRGLHFRRARVLQFAVRRMGFVLKWALVIVLATLALIHLPLFVEAWFTGDPIGWRTLVLVEIVSRPALATIMLLLSTVQIRLVLHNDSFRGVRSTWPLPTKAWPKLPCFLDAIVPPFLLQFCDCGSAWLGAAIFKQIWSVVLEIGGAISGGWILASWVCFYKRCEASQNITF
jgi:hypothetical protein